MTRGRPPKEPVILEKLPNRLREHRLAKGWSQEKLAAATGSKAQTVARHETIKDHMSVAQMERYARALGVRPEELLADSLRIPRRLRQLLRFAEGLSEAEVDRLLRLGHALAEPGSAYIGEDDQAA